MSANQLRPGLIERGKVPCLTCGKPHNLRRSQKQADRREWGTWAHPKDGHAYWRMSAEQICAYYTLVPKSAGAAIVDEYADDLRRLA